ncbi:MAG TPA: hypothetical protein VGJ63_14865 [Micromonosporaceae bacterium]|jgi:hypothetical protein
MTVNVLSHAPAGTAIQTLAGREASRMVRHPVYVVLLLYFVVLAGIQATAGLWPPSRGSVRDLLVTLGLLWLGPATFFAANLIASSARRAHAESQLAATPTAAQARTLAICLGVLLPAGLAAGFAVMLWLVEHNGTSLEYAQGPAELAVIPLCTLGGGLLGVATDRWLPWRGAPVVVGLAVLAWVVAVMDRGRLQWTAPWTMSSDYYHDAQLAAGSHVWHAVYLLGLALLAGVAALLRHASYRRPLLTLGGVLLVGTLAACWAQMR